MLYYLNYFILRSFSLARYQVLRDTYILNLRRILDSNANLRDGLGFTFFPFVKWMCRMHMVMLDGNASLIESQLLSKDVVVQRGYTLVMEKGSVFAYHFDTAYATIYENRVFFVGSTLFGAWAHSYANNITDFVKQHMDAELHHLRRRSVISEATSIALSHEFAAELRKRDEGFAAELRKRDEGFAAELRKRDEEAAEFRKKVEEAEAARNKRSTWWGIRA